MLLDLLQLLGKIFSSYSSNFKAFRGLSLAEIFAISNLYFRDAINSSATEKVVRYPEIDAPNLLLLSKTMNNDSESVLYVSTLKLGKLCLGNMRKSKLGQKF